MRPLILVTNDDGVFSPGLAAAVGAVQPFGDVLVAAPFSQQTGMGRSFPRGEGHGRMEKVDIAVGGRPAAYGVNGSPAQAVAHAIMELTARRPALCVSGINYGANLGLSITCSGTLGAAFEAYSHGVPALAVSREAHVSVQSRIEYEEMDWEKAKGVTARLAARILSHGLPPEVGVINVNIPDGDDDHMRLTRQSRLNYQVFSHPGVRDFNGPFRLASEMDPDLESAEPESDVRAFHFDKVVSVTPLAWDMSLTAMDSRAAKEILPLLL